MTANVEAGKDTGNETPKQKPEVMLRRIVTKQPDGFIWRLSERTSTYKRLEFGMEDTREKAMEKCTEARERHIEANKKPNKT